jgi:CBS domain-containing protein
VSRPRSYRAAISHLPVVGDAGLAGIVDITDVCRALLAPDDSGARETGPAFPVKAPNLPARRWAPDAGDGAA